MPRPELLAEKAMLPYVIGHVIGDPNDPVVPMEYITCTPTLRIKEVNQMPDNLAEPWGWYGILMSDGVSWLDVTMITFDVDELYDDPFTHMAVETETSYEDRDNAGVGLMSRYQVTRSYTACAVYEVNADTEVEATRLAMQGEGYVETYDSDWDEEVTIDEIL